MTVKRKFNKIGAIMLTLCMVVSLGVMYPARVYAETYEGAEIPEGTVLAHDDEEKTTTEAASAASGEKAEDTDEPVGVLANGEKQSAEAGNVTINGDTVSEVGVMAYSVNGGDATVKTGDVTVTKGDSAVQIWCDSSSSASITTGKVTCIDANGVGVMGAGSFTANGDVSVTDKTRHVRNLNGVAASSIDEGQKVDLTVNGNVDVTQTGGRGDVNGVMLVLDLDARSCTMTANVDGNVTVKAADGIATGAALGAFPESGNNSIDMKIKGDLKAASENGESYGAAVYSQKGSNSNLAVAGDVDAGTNGVLIFDLGGGNVGVLVEGTVKKGTAGSIQVIESGKIDSDLTLWKAELNDDGNVVVYEGSGSADENAARQKEIQDAIKYIIKIDDANKENLSAEGSGTVKSVDGNTIYVTALQGEAVELKAADGWRIKSASTTAGEIDERNGSFFLKEVVLGGGIILSAIMEKITPNPDPTPDNPTPVNPTPDNPTPVNPTPTPTPTPAPAGGGGAGAGGGAAAPVAVAATAAPIDTAIADNDVPLAENEPAEAEDIIDEAVPMSAPEGGWSLVNLLAALLSALLSIVGLGKRKEQIGAALKYSGLAPAVAAIATFILTSDLTQPMQMTNKYTPLMIGFAAIGACIAGVAQAKNNKSEEAEA